MKRPRGRPPHADLLPVEWSIVQAVQHGMRNVEIAKRQGISVNALKFYAANALANLRPRRASRMVALFTRQRLGEWSA